MEKLLLSSLVMLWGCGVEKPEDKRLALHSQSPEASEDKLGLVITSGFNSSTARFKNGIWELRNTGQIAKVETFKKAKYRFQISARGSYYHGWPVMQVFVGGRKLGQKTIHSATLKNYTFEYQVPSAGKHHIVIKFPNDAWGGSKDKDRNLFVKSLNLTQTAVSNHYNVSTGFERMTYENFVSPAWTSDDFKGTVRRSFNTTRLHVKLSQNKGGFDTAVGRSQSWDTVDSLARDFSVHSKMTRLGTGSGQWWYGPKISVNWPTHYAKHGAAGWYENYIIDNSSKTQANLHQWYTSGDGKYLGSTTQNGATYKHYVKSHAQWKQFIAIRQQYRQAGWTNVQSILKYWRSKGLPNKKIDSIKVNLETSGVHDRSFDIQDIRIPEK